MNEVIKYYNSYDEDIRLEKTNIHKTEYLTTIKFLNKFINEDSRILDACAGTGKYSFYLESKGHTVTSVDIVPRFVDIIKEKKKALSSKVDVHLGDVQYLNDLNLGQFDAVLCMGALYHLKQDIDRRKAIEQCVDSLKDDGILVVSYINRYATFLIEFSKMNGNIDSAALNEILDNGCNDSENSEAFYYSSPEEIDNIMSDFNIEKITNIGADGIGYMLGSKVLNLDKEDYEKWLDFHYKTCENENLIGYSLHGLYIGRKVCK